MNNPLFALLPGFGKITDFIGNAEAALGSGGHPVAGEALNGPAPDFDTLDGYQGGSGIHMQQPRIIRLKIPRN